MALDVDQACSRCAKYAAGAGIMGVAVGSLVLIGWWLDITLLTSLAPSLASMKPNTALCFVLAGSALLLRPNDLPANTQLSAATMYAAKACATIAALIGLLTLCEYLANGNYSPLPKQNAGNSPLKSNFNASVALTPCLRQVER